MKQVFARPRSLRNVRMHYCPGCGHSIIHRVLAESIDELKIREKTIVIAPVGCSVLIYDYIDCDGIEAAHGRAPAVATGLKRALPDRIIVSYQGDGDLAGIGTAETIHTANRGENITVIFVNNAIYGMTGGQMAPTTMVGQKTTTTPTGRNPELTGLPLRMCELINQLEAPYYIERVSVHDVKNINRTKRAIRKALDYQNKGLGYSFIEVLSMCPTGWGVTPVDAANWIKASMVDYYKLGVFRDRGIPQEVK